MLDAVGATNTALQFDLHKNCWSEVKWEGAIVPAARGGHSATVLNSKFLVVVGGTDGYTMVWDGLDLQDAWVLDLDTNSWQQLSPVGTLHAFGRQHTAVAASQESVVTFGGGFSRSNAAQKLTLRAGAAGGWELHVHALVGAPLTVKQQPRLNITSTTPPAVRGHCAVWTGREMIVWGGSVPGDTYSGLYLMTLLPSTFE